VRYHDLTEMPCSITRPLVVLGDRWTFLLVEQAFTGTRRFEDLRAALGISRSRLADRLERLVGEGILTREPYKTDAGRGREEYRLTDKGLALYPVLIALRDWGDSYMAPDAPPAYYRHRDCGGDAHVHIVCDVCGGELSAQDVSPEPGPGMTAPGQCDRPAGASRESR